MLHVVLHLIPKSRKIFQDVGKYSSILENENADVEGNNKKTAISRGFRFYGGEENRTVRQVFGNAELLGMFVFSCCISCDQRYGTCGLCTVLTCSFLEQVQIKYNND